MNRKELVESLKQRDRVDEAHPIEQYYRVAYVADRLGISPTAVRKLFRDHPGTRFLGRPQGTSTKRAYATMLIPASALQDALKRAA